MKIIILSLFLIFYIPNIFAKESIINNLRNLNGRAINAAYQNIEDVQKGKKEKNNSPTESATTATKKKLVLINKPLLIDKNLSDRQKKVFQKFNICYKNNFNEEQKIH